ncbi:Bone marrow proteoglycan [Fasciolopsis buskii]|uniref:Bone marrow proteoglycan n=1 Tax=Fasciolopsis buskii TaxID=27845 RepID=A0A8E0VNA6_9TREM|nr:Bone marrow proteoglycan [Fasciolopsis buski]
MLNVQLWNLFILCCFIPPQIQATERSRGSLGPRVFTFVHGDEQAKMNFTSADEYCKHTVGQSRSETTSAGVIQESGMWDGSEDFVGRSKNHSQESDLVLQTRLASVHSYPETLALVKWVSRQEKHSFWIGGTVSKTLNEYMQPIFVLQWTDGSRSDFSFFKLPNEELAGIRVGEHRCVSVDYHSGQWGVHPCSETRYFVCLTVPVLQSSPRGNQLDAPSERMSAKRPAVSMPEPWPISTKRTKPSDSHRRMTAEELRLLLS